MRALVPSRPAMNAMRSLRWARLPRATPWTCGSCQARSSRTRQFATQQSTPDQKPYYITTPIFYVNAGPQAPVHIRLCS